MKTVLLYTTLFALALYGCLKAGHYLANRKEKEPNENDDETHNHFV